VNTVDTRRGRTVSTARWTSLALTAVISSRQLGQATRSQLRLLRRTAHIPLSCADAIFGTRTATRGIGGWPPRRGAGKTTLLAAVVDRLQDRMRRPGPRQTGDVEVVSYSLSRREASR